MSRSVKKTPVIKIISNRTKNKKHYHHLFRRREDEALRRGLDMPCRYREVFDLERVCDLAWYVSRTPGDSWSAWVVRK